MGDAYNAVKKVPDEEKEAAMTKWFAEGLAEKLKLVEESLPGGQSGPWLVGSKMSYADVSYFQFLFAEKGFFDNADGAAAALKTCPKLTAACEAVNADAGITKWIKTRPAGSA